MRTNFKMTLNFSKRPPKFLRNPCIYPDQIFTQRSHLGPLNMWLVNFRFLLPVSGSAPKNEKLRNFFDLIVTPPELHLVDHVSPARRSTGRPTKISPNLRAVLIT